MLKKFLLAAVVIATVASISMAGCLSNISNPLGQSSKVNDYANNFVTYEKAHSPGMTFTDVNIQQNGTDAVRVSYNTKSSNGGTTTSAVNIKQFANVADATAFYDGIAFGYMPVSDNSNATAAGNPYLLTFGHNAIRNEQTLKINSFAIVYASASIAWQQDEFVAWGDVSGIAGSTTPTATATQTQTQVQVAPQAVATPAPTQQPVTTTDSYQVVITGPTVIRDGMGGTWVATVYKNGVPMQASQIDMNIDWFIDGHVAGGTWHSGGILTTDANGSMTTWAPYGAHTLNAEYIGVSSYPNGSLTVTHTT